MNNKSIEIMSRAGSWESLQGAIQGGANSVYFGIEQLNMRAKSSNNFTLDDLIEIASLCKRNNIKSYITLNTIIYDHVLILMKKIIRNIVVSFLRHFMGCRGWEKRLSSQIMTTMAKYLSLKRMHMR